MQMLAGLKVLELLSGGKKCFEVKVNTGVQIIFVGRVRKTAKRR